MFEHGLERAGYIEAPRDPYLAYEFLATKWRTIQHYGVEIDSRRYSGSILREYGDLTSPYHGPLKNKWPFQVDPDDVTKIYFRDLDGHWHTLTWEYAPSLEMPLSGDALAFARRLAASKYRYPDNRIAVADLLERWKLGLATTPAERRIVLRLSREQKAFDIPDDTSVTSLPSVQKAFTLPTTRPMRKCHEFETDLGDIVVRQPRNRRSRAITADCIRPFSTSDVRVSRRVAKISGV